MAIGEEKFFYAIGFYWLPKKDHPQPSFCTFHNRELHYGTKREAEWHRQYAKTVFGRGSHGAYKIFKFRLLKVE